MSDVLAGGHHFDTKKLTFIGVLVSLGIVFGDIGTSPLYVMSAIIKSGKEAKMISEEYIEGALSCIIWTLTLQTTIKYVLISLRADNKGEGGILALFSLVKKMKTKWLYLVAIVGASALIADGVITPSLTVMASIEGLKQIKGLDLSAFFTEVRDNLEQYNRSIDTVNHELNIINSEPDHEDVDFVDVMIDDENIMIESNSLRAVRHVIYKFMESGYILRRDIVLEKMFRKDKSTRYIRVFKIINYSYLFSKLFFFLVHFEHTPKKFLH